MKPKMIRRTIMLVILINLLFFVAFTAAEDFKYGSHGKRDPFVPLVGQDKSAATSLIDITAFEDLKLEGIALGSGGKNTAIINGEMVKAGRKIGEIDIKKITANTVDLVIGNKPYTLKLSEQGGQKSGH